MSNYKTDIFYCILVLKVEKQNQTAVYKTRFALLEGLKPEYLALIFVSLDFGPNLF